MGDTPRVAGERLQFDDDVWAEEVDRFDPGGVAHRSAVAARRAIQRPGATVALRACRASAADGSRLRGCAKAYVPLEIEPSQAAFGFVFVLNARTDGRLVARLIAYGERHPQRGRSVYERAHLRLHGRYPDQ